MAFYNSVFLRLFIFGFLLISPICAFAQKNIAPIIIDHTDKKISLINKSQYAVSKANLKTIAQLQKITWKKLDSCTLAHKEFPDTILQNWISFSIQNDFDKDSTLLLKMSNRNQLTTLYENVNGKLILIGETGYGSKYTKLSVVADYFRLLLPIKQKKTQHFYVLNTKYIYNLPAQSLSIESFSNAYQDKNEELTLYPATYTNTKLWFAGFYFAVFVYCCLKFFYQRKDVLYLFYALASIFWFFRYSLQVNAIVLEFDAIPKINNGIVFLFTFIPQNFFYILFLKVFLTTKNHKQINYFINFCLGIWLLMIFVLALHFTSPELTTITKNVWAFQALPVIILTVLLSFYSFNGRGYMKFAFAGLVTISFALSFALVPKWLNIYADMPLWYHTVNKYVDIVTIAFAIDAILFLTAISYRDKINDSERIDLKIKNAENEYKILRLQMNPHFIFNCLNSINLYIEQNKSNLASNYLSKFSQLMRLSLSHSRKDKIVLSEEITMLNLYLELEAMRFKGKLNYVFKIEDNVEIEFIEIPSMLIQPHLENAIWHGLMHKKEGGKITIGISQNFVTQTLNVTIEDNGIGRAKAAELNSITVEKEKSYGTLITNERIAIFNEKFNAETKLTIRDLYAPNKQPTGTLVSINIHLI